MATYPGAGPLTADDALVDEGLAVLSAALESAGGRTPALA